MSSNCRIWKDLENNLNGKLSSKSLYMNLSKNRNNLKDHLIEKLKKTKIDLPIVSQESSNDTEHNFTEIDDNNSDNTLDGQIFFKIIFSYEEFIKIKPELHKYKRGPYTKFYSKLKPHFWTNLIFKKIWSSSKIPCNYVQKQQSRRKKFKTFFGYIWKMQRLRRKFEGMGFE